MINQNQFPPDNFDDGKNRTWGGLSSIQKISEQPDLFIVGIPYEGGVGGRGGTSHAPSQMRRISRRLKKISRRGHDLSQLKLVDLEDVAIKYFDQSVMKDYTEKVYRNLFTNASAPILTFGGDHSITYPIVSAASSVTGLRIGIVWFDAHPDLLDTYLGSKLTHGSPLRRIVDDGIALPENVLLVGTRAYDPGEIEFIKQTGINELPAVNFDDNIDLGITEYCQQLQKIAQRVDKFYISIDIDILDGCLVPGTGTPVAAGINTGLFLRLLELIPEPVLAYDIVEFSPTHDVGEITGQTVLMITTEILARLAAKKNTCIKDHLK